MLSVQRYDDKNIILWNKFNKKAKNHLFMFDRGYMDYHRDRFLDHSLIIFNDDEPVALFPACEMDGELRSHGGLTYGGFITDEKMKQHTMMDCIRAIKVYAEERSFKTIVYKTIPHIYHQQPAEEDRFALYATGARLTTVDAST